MCYCPAGISKSCVLSSGMCFLCMKHNVLTIIYNRLVRSWQKEGFLISSSFFLYTPEFSKQDSWSLQTFCAFNKLVIQLFPLLVHLTWLNMPKNDVSSPTYQKLVLLTSVPLFYTNILTKNFQNRPVKCKQILF